MSIISTQGTQAARVIIQYDEETFDCTCTLYLNGKYEPSYDYIANDKADALNTAAEMIKTRSH